MVMANFMTLNEIDPKSMYKWFMEFSLDSYNWVMEFNIYSMGSYSDGGAFTSKPYISGSNYILKMSNYKSNDYKSNDWTNKWDYLFWKFILKQKAKIQILFCIRFHKNKTVTLTSCSHRHFAVTFIFL